MQAFKLITIIFILTSACISLTAQNPEANIQKGSYNTGKYQNLFVELLGKSSEEVETKINHTWDQLFYGNDETERVYYPAGPGMAYIKDTGNNDVRTEGMSYGLMIAVQLNKKTEFDCLWNWAKTYMQHKSGQRKDYFAWQLNSKGEIMDSTTASDGEEWFVTSLFFASARWGNGTGIYNYKAEAQTILDAMLSKEENSNERAVITNMFNKKEKQVVFVPNGAADNFTDPSYHLPHYYELWARWADKQNEFWYEAADTSRNFFKKAANPKTGLMPDYANFDGTPANPWNSGSNDFRFDAWRAIANVAVDYAWFAKDTAAVTECNRLLDFFYSQGINSYGNNYSLDGKALSFDHSTGLVAMNAVAALASTNKNRIDFVRQLWEVNIPQGKYRYYDGLLYMLGLLHVSGTFKIYDLTGVQYNKPD